jgi:LemA protein
MKWGVGILIGLVLLLMILGGSACGTYNSLTQKKNGVQNAFSNVDTTLQRRADLIPNLVETVKGYAKHEEKGYAKHEEKVFTDIAEARSRLLGARTVEEKSAANDAVSGALGRLLALQENYPQLKADQGFLKLQDELAGTENRIQVARRDYNTVVLDYNNSRDRFPGVIFANLFGFERAQEFQASESSRQVPNVKF